MAKRQQIPDWLGQLYNELTKPPYFLQSQNQSPSGANQRATPTENVREQRFAPADPLIPTNEQAATASANQRPSTGVNRTTGRQPVQRGRSSSARTMYVYIPQPVLERYPFEVERREQLPNVLRIHAANGKTYAVKRTELTVPHVRFIHRALNYAQKQGFTRFSRFQLTKKKAPALLYDGNVYYATEWVEGQPANFTSAEQVAQTAYSLAQFHEATKGFTSDKFRPKDAFDIFALTQSRNRDLRQMLYRAEARDDKDAFDELFASLKDTLLNDASQSLQLLQQQECVSFLDEERVQAGLCHLDVIPGNCLYTTDERVHLIDFELTTYAPRALDIAHLLRRSMQLTDWDSNMAYACFLHFNAVKTMPKEEYKLVQAILQFPYRAWRLAHTRYHYFSDQAQLDELAAYLEQEPKRQQFLTSLAEQIEHLSIGDA